VHDRIADEQAVELHGFDARGVLVGSATLNWRTGSWTVYVGRASTCNVWGRAEAERYLRVHGATTITEGDGHRQAGEEVRE
jgi:hypothetical protein